MAAEIAACLPPELLPLGELAYDFWWSWQPGGPELFRDVDPPRWEACGHNPVRLLREASLMRVAAAARDPAFVARVEAMAAAHRRALERPFAQTDVATPERPIAFFCAEYGLHPSLPIYSGGLGVLAGDLLKQASDSGLALLGVGLFYRRGYFRQRLDRSGWQHEYWVTANPEELPMRLETDPHGAPLVVRVRLRDRAVAAQIWRVQVGRIPLYLLDTDVPENDATSRWITSTLYVGDRALRLMQYAMLAIGGVRALRALGRMPSVYHLNEGHAALAALELVREARARGASYDRALEETRARIVFTTHTPVSAGNERYHASELADVLSADPEELGVDTAQLLALGRGKPDDGGQHVGVTEIALRTSRAANGVSRAHGEVARGMWQHLWPGRDAKDVPIGHVTNGVHAATWTAPPMRALLDRHLGPTWIDGDPAALARVATIPDEELWAVRNELRARLVRCVRDKSVTDRLARGEPIAYAEGAAATFDEGTLTIGFARRVASYKRLHLLIADRARALGLLHGPRRLQVVIAGRAHPMDEEAKHLVKAIFALKQMEAAATHVAFLEDYDLSVASALVQGCDLWLNLPRPPLEASGTSGMKAALNGALNLSVLDGWWHEGFQEGADGWAIASVNERNPELQDARDAETLYGLLEREVVPSFYDRDAAGVPREWLRRVKASISSVASNFTARRMLGEYVARVYGAP